MSYKLYISVIFLCFFGCTVENTKIVTDFDYVKLTQSPNPLSAYYVKGTVRGMPFSYSTNDVYYASTNFNDTISSIIAGKRLTYFMLTIGNFGNYLPIWFYVEAYTMTIHDFVQNLKVNQTYPMGKNLGVDRFGFPSNFFYARLQVLYYNQYGSQFRDFTCCTPSNTGTLTITDVQNFNTYVNVTFEFKGPLYSTPGAGDILYFGEASIEMCVRINQ